MISKEDMNSVIMEKHNFENRKQSQKIVSIFGLACKERNRYHLHLIRFREGNVLIAICVAETNLKLGRIMNLSFEMKL